jgi:hypothetical protein
MRDKESIKCSDGVEWTYGTNEKGKVEKYLLQSKGQQTEVAGKASWQPFAPPQEMIGSDDDDNERVLTMVYNTQNYWGS